MNINDFSHQKRCRCFELKINEIEVFIPESQMSDEVIALTEKIVKIYPQKISAIVEYLSLTTKMDNDFKETLAKLLHKPRIRVEKKGGTLNYGGDAIDKSYLDQWNEWSLEKMDECHLLNILFMADYTLELKFKGALESFGRVIAGDKRCKLKFNAINIRNLPAAHAGSVGIAGVYTLIFNLIEDIIQRSGKKNTLIKKNLLENDICVLECEAFGSEHWINDTEEYDDALELKVIKALSDTCEVHFENEIYAYRKGALDSRTKSEMDHRADEVKIMFRLDKMLFSYEKIEYYTLFYRMKELAELNGHVTFHLADEKNKNVLHFSNGLETMLKDNMDIFNFWDSYYNPINIHFIEDDIDVSVSMTYGFEADAKLSYVNNIRTYDGGAHMQGLYDGILVAFEKYMKSHMGEDMVIMQRQVVKGLNFVIHIKMDHPRFHGSVKRGLVGEKVYLLVKNGVIRHLYAKLESDPSFLLDSRAVCEADLREILEHE